MKKLGFIALPILVLIASCETVPSASSAGPRTIVLGGETYSEEILGKFPSWRCRDYVDNNRTLVEVGLFSNANLEGFGFVLYDGSYSGEATSYQRKGINHRWDWGPNGTEYAFVVKPDGTGLFYDFSTTEKGESVKANEVYKCYKRS